MFSKRKDSDLRGKDRVYILRECQIETTTVEVKLALLGSDGDFERLFHISRDFYLHS